MANFRKVFVSIICFCVFIFFALTAYKAYYMRDLDFALINLFYGILCLAVGIYLIYKTKK